MFLARHGYGHTLAPHEINYRANIWALKELKVDGVVSVAGQRCDPQQSVFLQARRRDVPRGAPWTNLTAWAIEVELGAPLAGQAGVTVAIDEKMSVHLGPAGVVVAGSFRPCRLAGARRVLIEPRFDGRSNPYYWIAFARKGRPTPADGTDLSALAQNRISVTPLRLDLTDQDFMTRLAEGFD